MLAVPRDGLGPTLDEPDLGRVADGLAGLVRRAHPGVPRGLGLVARQRRERPDEGARALRQRADGADHAARDAERERPTPDGRLERRPDLGPRDAGRPDEVRLAARGVGLGEVGHAAHEVGHVHHRHARNVVATDDREQAARRALRHLVQVRLAGPVDGGRADDRRAEIPEVAADGVLHPRLAEPVHRDRPRDVGLGRRDRPAVGPDPVGAHGLQAARHEHARRGARLADGVEEGPRAVDVGVVERGLRAGPREAGDVGHERGTLDAVPERVGVGQVARDRLHGQALQPLRGAPHERADGVAPAQELLGEVAPDEARPARDEGERAVSGRGARDEDAGVCRTRIALPRPPVPARRRPRSRPGRRRRPRRPGGRPRPRW